MKLNKFILIIIFFLIPNFINASESSGTIDSSNKNALICHSVDCSNPTPSIINFLPTGTTLVTIDDVNGVDGVAWGNAIGWINFDPTGAEGLTIDSSTGIISGKAWSQVSGWINFSVTGQSVKINNDGEFEGWAWTGGPFGGWIKFDCSFNGACLKTDWRPLSVRSVTVPENPISNTTSGSGGSTVPNGFLQNTQNTTDTCLNIPGIQSVIPTGYGQDEGGICAPNVDYCKNINGVQTTIPSSYVLNGLGQCILLTKENKSEFIPEIDKSNINTLTSDKIETYTDYCPNLFGLQSKLPEGYVVYNQSCVPEEIDYCSNLLGKQYEIPENMKITNEGQCVKMTQDEIESINTAKGNDVIYSKDYEIKILSFSFIPDFVRIYITIPFLEILTGFKYKLDLISLFIFLNIIGGFVLFIKIYKK